MIIGMNNKPFPACVRPFLTILLLAGVFSCSPEQVPGPEPDEWEKETPEKPDPKEKTAPHLTRFGFYKADNSVLREDIVFDLEKDPGMPLQCFIPHASGSLIARFDGVFDRIECRGIRQFSGVSRVDYSMPAEFVLSDTEGRTQTYQVQVIGYNGLPILYVDTDEGKAVTSKTSFVDARIRIANAPEYPSLNMAGKIRGRGNATWVNYPKKPYKIKLEEKKALLGFPENRDWVLLAEYCDKSFLRTTLMCLLSTAVGMEYTIRSQPVELYLNGMYQGIYLLADQVEKAKERVRIEKDGFLFEDDNRYNEEPLYFTSRSFGFHFTFKYPDADDGKIVRGDAEWNYITAYVDEMEAALRKIPEDCTSYRGFMDITSFAQWYLVMEVLGNWDPNFFYVLPTKGDRVRMMPCWDAEWSLGLAVAGNPKDFNGWYQRPHEVRSDMDIWGSRKYFPCLFKDPAFVDEVKRQWGIMRAALPEIRESLDRHEEKVSYAVDDNFKCWPVLGKYQISVMQVTFPTWEEEVSYARNYFEERVRYLDSLYQNP